ncbi:hypothetical protein BJ912DRAFT_953735 [Pholiota molesta]|nr:hypothetical protein BJ912DRAFT_953735 [Pholiota molesta]
MDFQAKPPHRRMIKPRQYDPTSSFVTQTLHRVPVVSGLPSSTAAFAGVGAFLGLILISVGGCCFYRRRKLRSQTRKAPSASFDQSAFVGEKKNPFTTGLEPPIRVDLTPALKARPPPLPIAPSSASSSEETGKSQSSGAFRVINNPDRLTTMPALPKAAAEKRRPSQRHKASGWNSPNPEEFIGSPPPSYDMANGFSPAQLPPQKASASPTTPTPPAPHVSHSKPSKKGANLQSLVVPQHDVPAPVPSPARSESFAHKDIAIPAPVVSALASSMPWSSSSNENTPKGSGFGFDAKGPRMMTVIAPYTPTLADELYVGVGDTVRLLQEYQDGSGSSVCLQERKRVVPAVSHKISNSSVSSFTTSWR